MRKKGFTIVELLAVVVILAVITLVSIPILINTSKNSKEGLYNEQVSRLEEVAYDWGVKNISNLPMTNKDARFLSLDELFSKNTMNEKDIIDPRTNKKLDGCIKITVKNVKYKFKYYEQNCDELKEKYKPKFEKTKTKYEAELGDIFKLPSIKATNIVGEEIVAKGPYLNGKLINYLDTTKEGEYTLIYEAYDDVRDIKANLKIKVKVVDTKDPTIIVNNKNQSFTMIKPVYADNFNIPKAIVQDNSKKKTNLEVTTNLSSIPGTYYIKYVAKDKSGNIGVLIITVKVVDDIIPVINSVSGNSLSWTNKDITLKLDDNYSTTEALEYSFDNGLTWQKENYKTFNSNQIVYMKIKDQNGIESDTYQENISKIDKSVPFNLKMGLKQNSLSGIDYNGKWTNKDIFLIPDGEDLLSGIDYYEISFDGINYTKFINYYNNFNEGVNNCFIRAVDNAKNTSLPIGPIKVLLDKQAPSVPNSDVSEIQTNLPYNGKWTPNSVLWTNFVSNTDVGSKIDHYEMSETCNEFNVEIMEDSYIFEKKVNKKYCIRSVDEAGNKSKYSKPYRFKIDLIAPSTPIVSLFVNSKNGDNYNQNDRTNKKIYASFSSSDSLSGIDKYQYSLDGNDYVDIKDNNITFDITVSGTIYVRSIDKVGNISKSSTFKIIR